ncbi:MAG: Imm49 family immunity protein [Bacteroidota bacterium]
MLSVPAAQAKALDALQDHLAVLAAGRPMADIGYVCEEVIDLFQALGASYLLLDYDLDRFRRHLVHSGYGRRYQLDRCRQEGETTLDILAVGRTEAFFSTLVAGHDELVAELVQASPEAWMPGAEYEDDYCYRAVLHRMATAHRETDIPVLLDRFEESLQGASTSRFDLCRALVGQQPVAFREAFGALLADHEAWTETDGRRQGLDPVASMRSRLFVEGMALLRLGDQRGLRPDVAYHWCPRLPDDWFKRSGPWPEDPFAEVERLASSYRTGRATLS